jgi:nitrogen regulatory protein PII
MNTGEVKAFIHRNRIAEAIELIRKHAKTGQPHAGWIYVTDLLISSEIM